MKISEHLYLAEVIRSESAKRYGISNMPTEEHIANFKLLADNIFEPIRNHFKCPILISSGYRSKDLNNKIGGSKTSQHCFGQAIDIDMDGTDYGVTNADIFKYIKSDLPFCQLIWEFGTDSNPDWVHVSYSDRHRKEILKATRINGNVKYSLFK
jgi:zinc D-Ala-D-Ala carboxypeptidase